MTSPGRQTISVARASRTSRTFGLAGLAAVAVLVSVPWWATPGDMRLLVEALALLALAQMWNLLAGYAGLVSIGQQAYIGLGAYGFYYFADKAGLHPFLSVFVAGFAAMIIAIPTAALVFRLRGGYFAIGTWVIAEVFRLIVAQIGPLGAGTGVSVQSLVAMSPSITATCQLCAKNLTVCSINEVLPAPGDAIILMAYTPASSSLARFSAAMSSLALRILSTIGIFLLVMMLSSLLPLLQQ